MVYTISSAAEATGSSRDTLRYYEKIGLVPRAPRSASGRRAYRDADITRLRFVRRAQSVGFSLTEIRQLLKLRENPIKCSRAVRDLAQQKCLALEQQVRTLEQMRSELALLLNLCRGDEDNCPILQRLEPPQNERRRL
ncbi:MAG: heavy metal-responsive transcriptional regulator [Steroidobacteraceae bacterium]